MCISVCVSVWHCVWMSTEVVEGVDYPEAVIGDCDQYECWKLIQVLWKIKCLSRLNHFCSPQSRISSLIIKAKRVGHMFFLIRVCSLKGAGSLQFPEYMAYDKYLLINKALITKGIRLGVVIDEWLFYVVILYQVNKEHQWRPILRWAE